MYRIGLPNHLHFSIYPHLTRLWHAFKCFINLWLIWLRPYLRQKNKRQPCFVFKIQITQLSNQCPLVRAAEPFDHHWPITSLLNVDTNSAHLSHNMFCARNPKCPLPQSSPATQRSNRHRGQASLFSPSWSSAVSFVLYGCPHLPVCPFIPASSPPHWPALSVLWESIQVICVWYVNQNYSMWKGLRCILLMSFLKLELHFVFTSGQVLPQPWRLKQVDEITLQGFGHRLSRIVQ